MHLVVETDVVISVNRVEPGASRNSEDRLESVDVLVEAFLIHPVAFVKHIAKDEDYIGFEEVYSCLKGPGSS